MRGPMSYIDRELHTFDHPRKERYNHSRQEIVRAEQLNVFRVMES